MCSIIILIIELSELFFFFSCEIFSAENIPTETGQEGSSGSRPCAVPASLEGNASVRLMESSMQDQTNKQSPRQSPFRSVSEPVAFGSINVSPAKKKTTPKQNMQS